MKYIILYLVALSCFAQPRPATNKHLVPYPEHTLYTLLEQQGAKPLFFFQPINIIISTKNSDGSFLMAPHPESRSGMRILVVKVKPHVKLVGIEWLLSKYKIPKKNYDMPVSIDKSKWILPKHSLIDTSFVKSVEILNRKTFPNKRYINMISNYPPNKNSIN
jgi:hypothetical protein